MIISRIVSLFYLFMQWFRNLLTFGALKEDVSSNKPNKMKTQQKKNGNSGKNKRPNNSHVKKTPSEKETSQTSKVQKLKEDETGESQEEIIDNFVNKPSRRQRKNRKAIEVKAEKLPEERHNVSDTMITEDNVESVSNLSIVSKPESDVSEDYVKSTCKLNANAIEFEPICATTGSDRKDKSKIDSKKKVSSSQIDQINKHLSRNPSKKHGSDERSNAKSGSNRKDASLTRKDDERIDKRREKEQDKGDNRRRTNERSSDVRRSNSRNERSVSKERKDKYKENEEKIRFDQKPMLSKLNTGRLSGNSYRNETDGRHSKGANSSQRSFNKIDNVTFKKSDQGSDAHWDDTFISAPIKKTVSRLSCYSNDSSTKRTDNLNFEDYSILLCKYNKMSFNNFEHVEEITGDLFAMDKKYALAHCVAEDMNMGSGIAVTFRSMFKCVGDLLNQGQTQGGCAYLEHDNRYVYYLVTKRESSKKPTMQTMFKSVLKWKDLLLEHKVENVAIPRMGCGLDRLEWSDVKVMLEYVFRTTNVHLTVCNFQQADDQMEEQGTKHRRRKCYLTFETHPITEMGTYTLILYVGYLDGYVSPEIETLDKKFDILTDYKKATKTLGKHFSVTKQNYKYQFSCCVIERQKDDTFDFASFENCIYEINKENNAYKANKYNYVAMQELFDKGDSLLTSKVSNLLRNVFFDVNIHICQRN